MNGSWRRKYKDGTTLDSDDEWETSLQSESVALARQNRIVARVGNEVDFDLQGIFQSTSDPSIENDEDERKYQEQVSKRAMRLEWVSPKKINSYLIGKLSSKFKYSKYYSR